MKTVLIATVATVAAVLAGCATPTTGVVPLSDGLATITRQGHGAWVSTDSLKTAATLDGDAHCKQAGKTLRLIHSKEIQSRPGQYPEAQIMFKCE